MEWGLRDYKIDGQWGLEKDFHEYLAKMQEFMNLVKVVLKKTGTCWINLGDTYAGGITHSDFAGLPKELARPWNEGHRFQSKHKKNQVQAKSQFGIPQRFYADCIDNNWIARNFIPWIKENSMPSSVKDRFTNKWEPVMFFAKFQKYYFNLDAVREKPKGETKPFNVRVRDAKKGLGKAKMGNLPNAWKMSEQEDENYNEKGERNKFHGSKNIPLGADGKPKSNYLGYKKQDVTLGADGKPLGHYKGFNERWKESKEQVYGDDDKDKRLSRVRASVLEKGSVYCERGKNPGDIFRINPRPFPEAHFATFPVDLPLFILKCACPPKVCSSCGYPDMPTPNISNSVANTNGEELLQELPEGNTIERRSSSTDKVLLEKLLQPTDKKIKKESEYEFKGLSSDLGKGQIPIRTSVNNGKEIEKEIIENRDSSSYQRDKDRQSSKESDSNDCSRTQSSFKISQETNSVSSLSKMDEKRWSCEKCGSHDSRSGIVLDCFFGAGTVGLAAEKLGLDWKGIELSEEYIKIANKRLEPYNTARIDDYF